jgi:hypothetical protein
MVCHPLLLSVVCCPLFVVHCPSSIDHRPLSIVIVHPPLFVVPAFVICCPLSGVRCPSSVICRSCSLQQEGAATHCVLRPIALHCLPPTCLALSATPPLVVLYAARLPCIVPSCHVIHCPLATYKLYLDLIVAFTFLSLPLSPCHLSQRSLNATSTKETLAHHYC